MAGRRRLLGARHARLGRRRRRDPAPARRGRASAHRRGLLRARLVRDRRGPVVEPAACAAHRARRGVRGRAARRRVDDASPRSRSLAPSDGSRRDAGGARPTLRVEHRFVGRGYGWPSPESLAAVARARDFGLELEPIYTGKVMAALLSDAREGRLDKRRVLFMQTQSTVPLVRECTAVRARTPDEPRDLRA